MGRLDTAANATYDIYSTAVFGDLGRSDRQQRACSYLRARLDEAPPCNGKDLREAAGVPRDILDAAWPARARQTGEQMAVARAARLALPTLVPAPTLPTVQVLGELELRGRQDHVNEFTPGAGFDETIRPWPEKPTGALTQKVLFAACVAGARAVPLTFRLRVASRAPFAHGWLNEHRRTRARLPDELRPESVDRSLTGLADDAQRVTGSPGPWIAALRDDASALWELRSYLALLGQEYVVPVAADAAGFFPPGRPGAPPRSPLEMFRATRAKPRSRMPYVPGPGSSALWPLRITGKDPNHVATGENQIDEWLVLAVRDNELERCWVMDRSTERRPVPEWAKSDIFRMLNLVRIAEGVREIERACESCLRDQHIAGFHESRYPAWLKHATYAFLAWSFWAWHVGTAT